MITLSLAELVAAAPALSRLAEVRLPIKGAYAVARLLRIVKPDLHDYESTRDALVREFGAPAGPDQIAVKPEFVTMFMERVQELGAETVQLVVPPLDLETLGPLELSGADVAALLPLLAPGPDTPSDG